jgi:hypothetical protein
VHTVEHANPDGDICRYDEATHTLVSASLVDWKAFFVSRDLARWRDDEPDKHRPIHYWFPACNSWDRLEQHLFDRWGVVTSRWWEPDTVTPPRWQCLVCHDIGRVRQGPCPGCHPAPQAKKPRRRTWVALDQPQLFG